MPSPASPDAKRFVSALKELYGKRWREKGAAALGLHPTTLWRYATGRLPVPKYLKLAASALQRPGKRRDPLAQKAAAA